MGQNQFDKQIKDRLQFHESEVSSGLWENIESQLHDQGKRRLAPLYLITTVGSIFLFLGIGIYWFNKSVPSQPHKVRESIQKISPSVLNQTKNQITLPANESDIIISNQNTGHNPSHHFLTGSGESLPLSNTISSKKTIVSKFKKQDLSSANGEGNISIHPEITNEAALAEVATLDFNGQVSISNLRTSLFTPLHSIKNRKHVIRRNKKITPKDNCLNDFNQRGIGMSLDVYYGNDIPLRSMRARESAFTNLVNKRKETETPLYSYSLGARLGFRMSEKFNIYTGAHFSRINEKFEYTDPESSQTKVVKTTLYIKDSAGNIKDSTFTFDTIYIPGTLVYKVKNQYSMIDIPFLVGFTLLQKDRLSLDINIGVMANLVFQKSGMALNNDVYSVRNFKDLNAHNFHNSLGISSYIGAQFAYGFYDRFSFFIEPNIRFYHRGLTSKDYPVIQKYAVASFFTGLKYNF